ncbi:MAG: rhodanese-like domain-containing protein [candidate division KSB1 bacterium]|nr:rhodanese-like domain-containing protein [candidate division KSB1 bacterium]
MFNSVTSYQLLQDIEKEDTMVLDVRPSATFNGWTLKDMNRGGHIPGAVSFPLEWFEELQIEELEEKLDAKISGRSHVIITGFSGKDAEKAGQLLTKLGFDNVTLHNPGMKEYSLEPGLPLDHLPGYRKLVPAVWLDLLLKNRIQEEQIDYYVLAHVNFDNWGDYDKGHIPGAIWLDTLDLESEEDWNRRSPQELEKELCNHGITKDTTVILYGRTSNPNMSQEHPGKQAGHLGAMRAALILMYAGVQDVRVLDGGLDAWLRIGGAVTRKEFSPNPVKETGLNIPEHPEYIVDMPKAREMIDDSRAELVSMRSWPEYIGEVSGYHYVKQAGRISGALWGNNGSDAYHMENYRNHDDTMRSYDEIEAMWSKMGVTPDKKIAFYCGTGWRASEAFYYAWLMGYKHVSIYDGGWSEWSSEKENPVETGTPA